MAALGTAAAVITTPALGAIWALPYQGQLIGTAFALEGPPIVIPEPEPLVLGQIWPRGIVS